MKKLVLLCICTLAFAVGVFAQAPTASPMESPAVAAATTTTTTTSTPTPTVSASPSDLAEKIHRKLEKKFRGHGIIIDTENEDADHRKSGGDIPGEVIPLVAVVFMTIFGAPVLIVLTIGLITLLVTRMRQRTIRVMVEKGQPIPAELLAPEARGVRRRSDVRRGVVWTMVGVGLMVWLGAINDWEGGAWSFGLIPFLIGVGYLLVWKLERKNDVPPPPPVP